MAAGLLSLDCSLLLLRPFLRACCCCAAAAATPDQMYMIVGFEVSPCSIKRTAGKPIEDIMCDNIDRVPTPQVRTRA